MSADLFGMTGAHGDRRGARHRRNRYRNLNGRGRDARFHRCNLNARLDPRSRRAHVRVIDTRPTTGSNQRMDVNTISETTADAV